MAGVNQIITKGISLVTKYADDAARVASTSSDDVARYVKACGKRSILECKPLSKGFKIDPSKLGYEYEKGKYIFATEDAAKEYAKTLCMKPAKLPLGKQIEVSTIVEGRKVLGYQEGNANRVGLPCHKVSDTPIYDIFHYHPSIDKSKTTLPLSNHGGDLLELLRSKGFKSFTAFNELGEYNTVTVLDPAKFREGIVYNKLLPNEKSLLSSKFYNSLAEACDSKGITEALSEENPQKYAQLLHEVYKETLHKFGLKYTTDFSNLA